MALRFADFVLDLDSRQLRRGDGEVHLSPKAFELLRMLVSERPKAISKTDLQERLWPNTFVAEANLPNLVGEIRTALGDDPQQPKFIRTVHRFGYAFAADTTEDAGHVEAICALVRGNRRWPLADGENIVGREGDGAAWFDSPTVSRRHARITIRNGEATAEDLGSKNGTFVRGRKIGAPTRLEDGDELKLGSLAVTFSAAPFAGQTQTIVTKG